jgi:hypothetical protein
MAKNLDNKSDGKPLSTRLTTKGLDKRAPHIKNTITNQRHRSRKLSPMTLKSKYSGRRSKMVNSRSSMSPHKQYENRKQKTSKD